MKVFFQDRIIPEQSARVSVYDHGFLYGDGIYETVHAYDYQVFHWPEHFRRLKQSARRLALRIPWSSGYLLSGITQVLKANKSPNASVRITISRGPGPLGLDPRLCPKPTLAMLLHPARPLERLWKNGVSIGITQVRRNHPLCLDPLIKANNSLNTILARMEATKMRVFEAVLLNLDGFLTEGTTSNIFFVRRGQIFTPALSCGLLEGVTRASVIRLARRAGIKVHEGRYTPVDLRKADEIFLTSTTLEVVPVVSVVNRPRRWGVRPGPLTRRLHALFRRLV